MRDRRLRTLAVVGLMSTGLLLAAGAAPAQEPPKPAGPTLSDVLSAPVPDSRNVKTGRGTFDTLSGSPLAR